MEMKTIDSVKKKNVLRKIFSKKTLNRRLPITKWITESYKLSTFIQDLLAGITVGATAVAQGIAFAMVADLSPEYGLYSLITGGFIYTLFGNCRNMSVGPTAILSALTAKFVRGLSSDFAVLATFLAGLVQLTLGIFQLGFLVEFISGPVITGFITGAVLQVNCGQLKTLFGMSGDAGNTFVEAIENLYRNYNTLNIWDTVLGVVTMVILLLLKKLGDGCSRNDSSIRKIRWFACLARNTIVVVIGIVVAFICYLIWGSGSELTIIGEIKGGMPSFQLPAFSTTVGNQTYDFKQMLETLGPQSIVLPLISLLEVVVIAKAFTPDSNFDTTQEILAVGLCNFLGSFLGSMPTTGSFSRSAILKSTGAQTPLAGVFVSLIIILSLSVLMSLFYFIPKCVLAALIILSVASLLHTEEMISMWKTSKKEFFVMFVTVIVCCTVGLEYGVIVGVVLDMLFILFKSARPRINESRMKINGRDVLVVALPETVSYCSAEYIRKTILRATVNLNINSFIIIDGTNTLSVDTTVAKNIMDAFTDTYENHFQIVFLNFNPDIVKMMLELNFRQKSKFVNGMTVEKLIENSPGNV